MGMRPSQVVGGQRQSGHFRTLVRAGARGLGTRASRFCQSHTPGQTGFWRSVAAAPAATQFSLRHFAAEDTTEKAVRQTKDFTKSVVHPAQDLRGGHLPYTVGQRHNNLPPLKTQHPAC